MPRFRLVSVMASPVKKGQRFYSLKRRQVVIIGPSGCNFRDDPLVWHAMTLSAPAIDALYRQLEVMRPLLVRFAVLQLRNQALAEDAVQDALIAVLEKPERFAGQSSLRTYVTGILKFKIIDNLRATTRWPGAIPIGRWNRRIFSACSKCASKSCRPRPRASS